MKTRRGAFIPDELQFKSKSSFFITLKVGGQTTLQNERLTTVRTPTLADIEFASPVVLLFCHAMLFKLYGRRWMKRDDIRFSALAVPETKDKQGNPCPLHFHLLFDGSGLAATSARDFKEIVNSIWTPIAQRRFGHVPGHKTYRSRKIKKALAYVTKWLEPASPHECHSIFKSEKFRVPHRLAASNQSAPSQPLAR